MTEPGGDADGAAGGGITEPGLVLAEIAHWREAVDALGDLDVIAAPAAWAGLETYLQLRVRERLTTLVSVLALEAAELQASAAAGEEVQRTRERLLRLRNRYLQVETILDFYGDAVNSRTNPRLAALLRGLDIVASDSLDVALRPLGIEPPPVLVYLDKGLGASILRAGVRLWDQANPSPAAAVKITRHNLGSPTALLHETGHQVAHLTSWTEELADALRTALAPRSAVLADTWHGWASEVAADVYAFTIAGSVPLVPLANVVDGAAENVYRVLPGDPHPTPLVRVIFNAALCRSWFGPGPWDALARAWLQRNPPRPRYGLGADLARASFSALADIVDICTRRPYAAFQGRPITSLLDPRRASPSALTQLARRSGPALLTSPYLARRESLRIFAHLSSRAAGDAARPTALRQQLHVWLEQLGSATRQVA